MLKLLTAFAVLHIFSFTGAEAEYNVTKLELDNPYTFTSAHNLVTVWLNSKDGSLHTNSTYNGWKSCDFGYNWNLEPITDGIQAKALLGVQRLIVWGMWQQLAYALVHTPESGYETSYQLILADPSACNYELLDLPTYTLQGNIPLPYGDIMVVTYKDSFDVFLPGQKNCSPCRYDMEGNKVDIDYQLEFQSPDLAPYLTPKGMHIQLINPGDRKEGYFFSRNFVNNTAVIEHLDEHFKILKRLYVDHPVHSVSISSVWRELRISVCYASHNVYPVVSPDHLKVYCRQFNTDFQPKLSIQIPVNENSFVNGIMDLSHQIDALGNTYVGLIESSNRRRRTHDSNSKSTPDDHDYYDDIESREFRYFVYDKAGKLLKSHDLKEADRLVNPRNRSNGLYSLLLTGNKICINSHDFVAPNVTKGKSYLTSRCFDISNYRPPK